MTLHDHAITAHKAIESCRAKRVELDESTELGQLEIVKIHEQITRKLGEFMEEANLATAVANTSNDMNTIHKIVGSVLDQATVEEIYLGVAA